MFTKPFNLIYNVLSILKFLYTFMSFNLCIYNLTTIIKANIKYLKDAYQFIAV